MPKLRTQCQQTHKAKNRHTLSTTSNPIGCQTTVHWAPSLQQTYQSVCIEDPSCGSLHTAGHPISRRSHAILIARFQIVRTFSLQSRKIYVCDGLKCVCYWSTYVPMHDSHTAVWMYFHNCWCLLIMMKADRIRFCACVLILVRSTYVSACMYPKFVCVALFFGGESNLHLEHWQYVCDSSTLPANDVLMIACIL